MSDIRSRVRRVIYAFSTIIVAVILIRFGLKLFGVTDGQALIVDFFYQFSYLFTGPFIGIAQDIKSGSASFEVSSIVSILLWISIFLIIAELVCAFLYESAGEVFQNLVNMFFKFFEFFLICRILFRAFAVQQNANGFVDIIYFFAGVVYYPFAGIAPVVQIGAGVIELSTVIALIIVIIIDLVTDGFLQSIFGKPKDK